MPEQKKSKRDRVSPGILSAGIYKLVAGLGNPSKEFENTYHNAGVMALAYLVRRNEEKDLLKFRKYKGLFEYEKVNGVVFMKPLVFMNESGAALRAAAREFGIPAKNIAIIHDDSDIPIGDFKISFGKNAGGHRGVQSVIDAIRTNAFTRIRVGIRPKTETQRKKAGAFVLKSITKKDKETLHDVFEKIEEVIAAGPTPPSPRRQGSVISPSQAS